MAPGPKVHLVGVGGVGMSALAHLFIESGFEVSGSDARDGPRLGALRDLGARIRVGHDAVHITSDGQVIFSPAVPVQNEELTTARALGAPLRSRAQGLAELVTGREVVAVAGSHGKTTTAAMLAFVLIQAGLEPGYMVGGSSPSLDRASARIGRGAAFVLEACEAFGALDCWVPSHCLVTNIDDEHVEHYGDVEGLRLAFQRLVGRTGQGGVIAVCGDDPGAASLGAGREGSVATFGIGPSNDIRAQVRALNPDGSEFTVFRHGVPLGDVRLALPGLHNVRNALGVVAVALGLGAEFQVIAKALGAFQGVDRRWTAVGAASGVHVFDDFAHHPAEVDTALAVARAALQPGGRLVVAFEPQLHSRVERLARQFAAALSSADLILLAPVDPAGEPASFGRGDDLLADAIKAVGTPLVRPGRLDAVAAAALDHLRSGDLLVTMGPGAISAVGPEVLEGLRAAPKDGGRVRGDAGPSISQGAITPRTEAPCLVTHVLAQAHRRPDAPAVECGEVTLTYAELVAHAAALADALTAAGVISELVVAVCLERSVWRVAAFLAVLLAGGVYLPLDPDLPPARKGFMLRDARVRVVVADRATRAGLTDGSVQVIDPEDLPPPEAAGDRLPPVLAPSAAAYVIYTSGTSGRPKGVIVEHPALANFARAAARAFGVSETSRLSNAGAFGFDVAIGDMAVALQSGACLVSPAFASGLTGALLARFVRDAAITHLSLTPSALSTLPAYDYPALSHVIVAGEVCPPDLAARWGQGRRFFNAYGPTEATIFATFDEYRDGEQLSIGRAMDNTRAFILGENQEPVARGGVGELWLSGLGLARKYLRRPELTAERFRTVNLTPGKAVRAYRTGDLATMLPDGRLRFLGRADDQVKLRGFRIELGEIEACLRTFPGVQGAAVDMRKDALGTDRLVAYLAPSANDAAPAPDQVRAFLAERLPSYMIPSAFVAISALPLTANGKLDRAALPDPPRSAFRGSGQPKTAYTAVEIALSDLFRKELRIGADFGIRDTFRELGADSLKTANLFLAVETHFGIELPSEAAAGADTVELLAIYVERALGAPKARADEPIAASIVRKQLTYLSAWTGARRSPEALIVTRGGDGQGAPLFWCFQGNREHERLAAHLGPHQTLHGMRSGHLLFSYSPDNVRALASRYADEMTSIQPQGSFRIGGNCQGGTISHEVARQLAARGREVAVLFLVDQGRFPATSAPVSLIFGARSHLNPYRTDTDPERIFKAAYTAGYSVDIISGRHGQYFNSPNVEALAGIIGARLTSIDAI